MNASSYITLAKSTLFVSVLAFGFGSCGKKETVEPAYTYSYERESAAIKQSETTMPNFSDTRVIEDGADLTQVSIDESQSTEAITLPNRGKFRQTQIGKKNSTLSIGPGTVDVSKFKQVRMAKKNSTL